MKTVTTQSETNFFILHDTEKLEVSSALEKLAALAAIKKHIESIEKVCKITLTNAIKKPAIGLAINKNEPLSGNKIIADNGNCRFVPVRKYPQIDPVRYQEIVDFCEENDIEFDINQSTTTKPTEELLTIIDNYPSIMSDIKEAILKSTKIPAKIKKSVENSKLSYEETGPRYYTEDFIDNVPTVCDGDVDLTERLFDLVEPQVQFKSFQLDNKQLSIDEALDVLKKENKKKPLATKEKFLTHDEFRN